MTSAEMDQSAGGIDTLPDSQLMLAYADNQAGAFECLYARNKNALLRYFTANTRDEALSLELFQETWMRVVRARDSYQASAAFSTWLYTIARNCMIDHHRKSSAQPDSSPFDDDVSLVEEMQQSRSGQLTAVAPLQPDQLAAISQQGEVLDAVLSRLPASQRESILLRHVAGMSVAEIADATGDKPETVKSRIRYAVNFIRNELQVTA